MVVENDVGVEVKKLPGSSVELNLFTLVNSYFRIP